MKRTKRWPLNESRTTDRKQPSANNRVLMGGDLLQHVPPRTAAKGQTRFSRPSRVPTESIQPLNSRRLPAIAQSVPDRFNPTIAVNATVQDESRDCISPAFAFSRRFRFSDFREWFQIDHTSPVTDPRRHGSHSHHRSQLPFRKLNGRT